MTYETGLIIGLVGLGFFIWKISEEFETIPINESKKDLWINLIMDMWTHIFKMISVIFIWIIPNAMSIISASNSSSYIFFTTLSIWLGRAVFGFIGMYFIFLIISYVGIIKKVNEV